MSVAAYYFLENFFNLNQNKNLFWNAVDEILFREEIYRLREEFILYNKHDSVKKDKSFLILDESEEEDIELPREGEGPAEGEGEVATLEGEEPEFEPETAVLGNELLVRLRVFLALTAMAIPATRSANNLL